ncbi:MAG: tripartite tricarboxylate transporter TctB family protein [Bacillaceae bacterium]|nr:tripartite tricarboxylate transporter TctB family protein [Bacillaceae bacterium]
MKKGIIVNIVLLGLSFFMLTVINKLPEPRSTVELGPAFFPRLLIYLIIILNIVQIFIALLSKQKEVVEETESVNIWKVVLMIASMIAYVTSLHVIDYRIGTFLFILAVMALLGVKKYRPLFLVPAIATGSIYVLFEVLLNVPLS